MRCVILFPKYLSHIDLLGNKLNPTCKHHRNRIHYFLKQVIFTLPAYSFMCYKEIYNKPFAKEFNNIA